MLACLFQSNIGTCHGVLGLSTTPTKALYCHRRASSLASRWLSQRRRSRRHAQQRPSLEMLSRQCKELARRNLSTAVTYAAHGPPLAVLKRAPVAGSSAALSATEVRVKMLAAPINPSDINMAEGNYGVKATLPAVGGNEGVAVVEKVGSKVTSVREGDWVIPAKSGFGTWREDCVADEKVFVKMPFGAADGVPVAYAATLAVNPSTAYRLLRDFSALKPGDVIIQNGANSMVGLCIVQMAREMGIKTINIVRADRPEVDTTLRLLSNLGGDVNVTDDYVKTAAFKELIADLPPVKLAFNCIAGDVAVQMAESLAPGGSLVTYGGMSKQPAPISQELVASRGIKLLGFWISAWNDEKPAAERISMLRDIAAMVREKKLTLFYEIHDFDDFDHALRRSLEPFGMRKVVLDMQYGDSLKVHDAKSDKDYVMFQQ